jgi:mRNA interferase RelE/StbE
MAYKITVRPGALRDLRHLPKEMQVRMRAAIDRLAEQPRPAGCVKLIGYAAQFRVRVGDYRVIFEIDDNSRSVRVVAIGHRREVFR